MKIHAGQLPDAVVESLALAEISPEQLNEAVEILVEQDISILFRFDESAQYEVVPRDEIGEE